MNRVYQQSIKDIESSGGNYGLTGPTTRNGDRAYGAYQVMGNNVPEWTRKHYGQELTPEQFLGNKEAQDAVFNGEFGSYVNKYGNPQDAASVWFTGRPLSKGGTSSDGYITGNEYVSRFNKGLSKYGDGSAVDAVNAAAGAQPSGTGALTSAFAPTESKSMPSPALSADETLGPGVLAQNQGGSANVIGQALTNMGASLAGISNPDQARVLAAQAAAMQKQAVDQGTWSHAFSPDGKLMLFNSKRAAPVVAPGTYAKPEPDDYQKEADKLAAKADADRYGDVTTAMATADQNLAKIQRMRKATLDPNVQFGGAGDIAASAKNWLYSMGGNPDGLTSTQLVEQAAKENQLGHAKALGANPTNYEDKIISASQGLGLDRTRELNLANQDALEAVYRHQKALAQEAMKYKKANGKLDDGWLEHQAQWEQEHPLDTSPRTRFEAPGGAAAPALPKGVTSIKVLPK